MEEEDPILAKLSVVRPESIIDIGCGNGEFTNELGKYTDSVVGIDIDERRIEEAKKRSTASNVHYQCADIRTSPFPKGTFEGCVSRFCLHHIHEWEVAVDKMCHIARRYVLIAEPFFDLRSKEKQRTYEVSSIFLELFNEVGYSHDLYLEPERILQYLLKKELTVESDVKKCDDLMTFDDYFGGYMRFVEQSARSDYWEDRIGRLRAEYQGKLFCDDDILYAFCSK